MKHSTLPRAAVLLGALFLTIALAGCSRASRQEQADQAPNIAVALTIAPSPARVGAAQALIKLTDAAGQPVIGATVQLKGDMSHPGMRPVLVEARPGGSGIYEAAFEWTMAGAWIVTVTATLPDGRTAVRRFDFSVTAP
jgi:nitrogen fixation protein FixH